MTSEISTDGATSQRLPSPRRSFAMLALLLGGLGCGDASSPPPPPLDATSCAALAGLSLPATEITLAEWNEGGAVVPENCRLQGVIDRRIGRHGVEYGIGFELRLPPGWTRRFYFQGGSGTDGVITSAVGSFSGGSALSLGFAIVSTDAGHRGGGPEFGLDPEARRDYGYDAIEQVTRLARSILVRVYGAEPERSYFVGCSNGGRQGFVAMQRFPDLFDGIVAGAPGFNLPSAAIGEAWNTQAVAAIATTVDANGKPYLPATFSDPDLALFAEAILRACDTSDGLADGIVDDLPGCDFDPDVLRCPGAKDATCLTTEQIGALEKIFGGARNSRGEILYSGFPWDAGVADPSPIGSLRGWTLGSPALPTNTALNTTLGAGALAFLFVTPPVDTDDPFQFALDFDFDADAPKILATSGEYAESAVDYMTATDTDLSRFQARGGKLIIYHGASDGVFSANDTVRWYEGVDAAHGGRAAEFARLFVVPGMGHCAGGPATDRFDAFTAIIDWVERGVAPVELVATASPSSPFPGRTRPLCPYPRQTRYRGEGSIEDAASFTCR
jgi:poly(3-hydroxybutyrate) depolymerase